VGGLVSGGRADKSLTRLSNQHNLELAVVMIYGVKDGLNHLFHQVFQERVLKAGPK
jgi:hypothetical protein